MRWFVVLALIPACSFHHGVLAETHDDAPVADAPEGVPDAAVDAPPAAFCPTDSHLRLCFSFDQDPLPPSIQNEGAANVSATLTNVTRLPRPSGGAAQLDTSSTIFVPFTNEITGIQSLEVWYRADTDPANGARSGLVDSNQIPPNIAMFLYRNDPVHTLRCGIGSSFLPFDVSVVPGTFYYVACTCVGGNLQLYLDGVKVGEMAASCATGGAFTIDGFTIGQNNNGGPTGANDWLVGAIDGVRLWDTPLTPEGICATAGKTGC